MRAYGIEDFELRRHFLTCYHETGHAIAAFWRGHPVKYIDVVETEDRYGAMLAEDNENEDIDFVRNEAIELVAGEIAEGFAWDMANGIDAIARKVFLRLFFLVERGAEWDLDSDIDRAIDLWRFVNPRRSVDKILIDLTGISALAFELLWRYEYELHDVADKLFRRASGRIEGKEFESITKRWQRIKSPKGIWLNNALDIVRDYLDQMPLSNKPLPPPGAKPIKTKKRKAK